MANAIELRPSDDIAARIKRAKDLYDTVTVVQNDASTDFFAGRASGVKADNNYANNPFPGNNARHIFGIGIEVLNGVIVTGTNISPVAILRALRDAVFTFTVDQDSQPMLEMPLSRLIGQADVKAHHDGTADDYTVTFEAGPLFRLPQAIAIAPNQTFIARIQWKDSSDLPTAAHWTTAGVDGGLRLRCTLQVGEE